MLPIMLVKGSEAPCFDSEVTHQESRRSILLNDKHEL